MPTSSRQNYHHGDLAIALRVAARDAIRAEGAAAFSLRSAARSVGVDIAAVYRHYKSKAALMNAVADDAYGSLGRRMAEYTQHSTDAPSEFAAVGRAYVEFALDEPELFRLMFGPRVAERPTAARSEVSPYTVLLRSLQRLDAERGCVESLPAAAIFAWSAVHGLAALAVDERLTPEEVRANLPILLDGVTRALTTEPTASER